MILKKKNAFSLFVTLVCVILITLFMVSLLSSVTTESTSTRLYTTSMDLNRMADSAVNIVEAQITAATSQSPTGRNADAISWASQPGMIRTYNSEGEPHKAFKLYSWNEMIISGEFDHWEQSQLPSATWASEAGLYVDLNEPVNGKYPIVDPGAEDFVEGFEVDENDPIVAGADNFAAMPVKWLYFLQDGTLVAPSLGPDDNRVEVMGATQQNPIVGRIGFWADDESTKLNSNTASEGTFWGVPHATVPQEAWLGGNIRDPEIHGFSTSIPTIEEFQRLPGHPSTTSLSAVFGDLLPTQPWIDDGDAYQDVSKYYRLTPRVEPGGSSGGLYHVEKPDSDNVQTKLVLDSDRLYASVGEMLFSPDRSESLSEITAQEIQSRQFFLTTQSRAPEENLFNKPRLSLWPLQSEATQSGMRNAKDDLIAFVSTLGNKKYHFERYTAFNYDGDQEINGFHSAASMTEDISQLPRNQDLLDYLYALSDNPVPGFGASLADKYPQDIEQILVNTFDFVRSGVNMTSLALPPHYNYGAFGFKSDSDTMYAQVLPTRTTINGKEVQGFGRKHTIHRASLLFFAADWVDERTLGIFRVPKKALDFDGDEQGFGGDGKTNDDLMDYDLFVGVENFADKFNEESKAERQDLLTQNPGIDPKELDYQVAQHMVDWMGDLENVFGKWRNKPDGIPDDVAELRPVSFVDNPGDPPDPDDETGEVPNFAPMPHYDGIGDPQTAKVGAMLLLEPMVVNPGYPRVKQTLRYRVSGLDNIKIRSLPFHGYPGSDTITIPMPDRDNAVLSVRNGSADQEGDGFMNLLEDGNWGRQSGYTTGNASDDRQFRIKFPWATPYDTNDGYLRNAMGPSPGAPHRYRLNTIGTYGDVRAGYPTGSNQKMSLTNDVELTIEVFQGHKRDIESDDAPIQTYTITFPATTMPLPQMYRAKPREDSNQSFNDEGPFAFKENASLESAVLELPLRDEPFRPKTQDERRAYGTDSNPYEHVRWQWSGDQDYLNGEARWFPDFYYGHLRRPGVGEVKNPQWSGSFHDPRFFNGRMQLERFNAGNRGSFVDLPHATNIRFTWGSPAYKNKGGSFVRRGDVIRTMMLDADAASPTRGDLRMIAALKEVPESYWDEHPDYFDEEQYQMGGFVLRDADNWASYGFHSEDTRNHDLKPTDWRYPETKDYLGYVVPGLDYANNTRGMVSPTVNGAYLNIGNDLEAVGDFNTGTGNQRDGAYIGKGDEAYAIVDWTNVYFPVNTARTSTGSRWSSDPPEYELMKTSFSPNRQISSPVAFGSLPTGIWAQRPWQTLLFNPRPAAGNRHPGFGSGAAGGDGPGQRAPFSRVPDHVYLDMFFMPISEPFPISERFSTMGKVNLNYTMMPFPHITRATGIHGVLKNARVAAIPNRAVEEDTDGDELIKHSKNDKIRDNASSIRFEINIEETLEGFRRRFEDEQNPDIFRSASEITTIHMVPKNQADSEGLRETGYKTVNDVYGVSAAPSSYDGVEAWWEDFQATGDNLRESVYNQIYPRVTTKSNTYRVHYRVQTLKKRRASTQTEWVEGADQVLGELRGSALIERYLDPNARNIPDYATENDPVPLQSFYRWRTISEQQFRP